MPEWITDGFFADFNEPTQPEPAPAARKIIQIAAGTDGDNYSKLVWALCSDGTLWSLIGHPGYRWEPLPGIPTD
jgi:hypothetical protein